MNAVAVLGTIQVPTIHGKPWNNNIRALCDTGSQVNLISKNAVKRLGLKVEKTHAKLLGIQSSLSRTTGCVYIDILIPTTTDNQTITVKLFVVSSVTRRLPIYEFDVGAYKEFSALKLADPNCGKPSEIDALFGINVWVHILKNGVVKSNDGFAAAQQTLFGWVIYKRAEESEKSTGKHIFHATAVVESDNLNELSKTLQRFWQVEDLPTAHTLTPDEKECERIFEQYHYRDNSGRYIVHLPFNNKLSLLGKSKTIALKQFFAMERKMLKNKEFLDNYHAFMHELIDMGHMNKITETRESGYYTPHHGVYTSNKFRVVINASCATSTGISLNECQLVGKKLQKDLAQILVKFRSKRIAVTTDVVKMFRQVGVAEQHQKYQKILWRFSPEEPVSVYQINRVIYGQAASPYLAVRAMQQCAYDYEHQYPIGAQVLCEAFYVDDGLTGADSKEEALELVNQLQMLTSRGKFELSKWVSNENIFPNSTNIEFLELKEPEVKTVLGLRWIPKHDTFVYIIEPRQIKFLWTKREILSEIGKLFDPNGYLAPVVVSAKIIMQKIWLAQIDWDDEVPNSILDDWINFLTHLCSLNKIAIPRWIGTNVSWYSELHAFSDASEAAYAAVVYVKTINKNGNVSVHLVQSKTKVAPLKQLSVPRLELCGAHLTARLAETVLNEFGDQIKICYFWTDSEIVLGWLEKSSSQLKTFVANRVAAIQHKTIEKGFHWNWVAGESNPADIASRGICSSKLVDNNLWWHGPEWLSLTQEYWPKQNPPILYESLPELKIISHVLLLKPLMVGPWYNIKNKNPMIAYRNFKRQSSVFILSKFSNFNKLKRVMAMVLRAIHKFKTKRQQKTENGPLKNIELLNATTKLIQLDQHLTFENEFKTQSNDKSNKDGTIFIDKNSGILRLNGRVVSENLTFDEQFPILLSPKGSLASLIIREAHLLSLHGGTQQVLQIVRQKYWIYKARQLTKSIICHCPTCFRFRAKLSKQLMAALPNSRTRPCRPFTICGVDYFGPVGLSSKTGRNPTITKAYGCVFVCFSTRAIHLELVSDQSTQQFIQALRRIINRRGPIKELWSDNAKYFVGANNFLKQIYEKQEEWAYGDVAKQFKLEWKFITPNAPHHGGLHEAAVKSTKYHLYRVIGKTNLTFEEYYTLLTQVEACLNSRPICPLSDDPNDLAALTPAHFLIGEPLITLNEPENLNGKNPVRLRRWELVQQMYQHFWSRWHTEYITALSQRQKWRDKERNIRIGDLVIIKEDELAPSYWSLGRVKETYQAPDGFVRSVLVSTIYGQYKRPVTKLGVLIPSSDETIDLSKLDAKTSFNKLV